MVLDLNGRAIDVDDSFRHVAAELVRLALPCSDLPGRILSRERETAQGALDEIRGLLFLGARQVGETSRLDQLLTRIDTPQAEAALCDLIEGALGLAAINREVTL